MINYIGWLKFIINKADNVRYKLNRLIDFIEKYNIRAYCVINLKPPVFHIMYGWYNMNILYNAIGHIPAYFIFSLPWAYETADRIEQLKKEHINHRSRFPQHNLFYLCNTPKEESIFLKEGLKAIFCNNNCFVDERLYRIMPLVEKRYDALYDAQLASYKRHRLAAQVENLALNAYIDRTLCDRHYISEAKKLFASAHWFNNPFSPFYRHLPDEDIVNFINQCKVGLCLSATEGPMYASIQYLLCGLPVVSTRSIGGRDIFFDDEYVKIVEDDPEAVRDGVQEMINRNIPPDYIRNKTIDKIYQHRQRYVDLIQGIYNRTNTGIDFKKQWDTIFSDKMVKGQKITITIRQIKTLKRRTD